MGCGAKIIFADTETSGLTRPYLPGGRVIWDYAHIARHPDGHEERVQLFVRIADLPPGVAGKPRDLPEDVFQGLIVGQFWDRHPEITGRTPVGSLVVSEATLAEIIATSYGRGSGGRPALVGCVPAFEDLGMAELLIRHGYTTSETPWHYRLVCVENLAAGRLREPVGWDPHDMARRLGLDLSRYTKHTAMGDAEFARDLYDAVMRPPAGWMHRIANTVRGATAHPTVR